MKTRQINPGAFLQISTRSIPPKPIMGNNGQTDLSLTRPPSVDRATMAQRKTAEPLKPKEPQKPLDIGLFSDDANQLDLVEMLQ